MLVVYVGVFEYVDFVCVVDVEVMIVDDFVG